MYMIRLVIELFDAAAVIASDFVEKHTQDICNFCIQDTLAIFSTPYNMKLEAIYGSAPIFYFVHIIYDNIIILIIQDLCC